MIRGSRKWLAFAPTGVLMALTALNVSNSTGLSPAITLLVALLPLMIAVSGLKFDASD